MINHVEISSAASQLHKLARSLDRAVGIIINGDDQQKFMDSHFGLCIIEEISTGMYFAEEALKSVREEFDIKDDEVSE